MPQKKRNKFLDLAIITIVLLIASAIVFNIFYFNYLNNLNQEQTASTHIVKEAKVKKVEKIETEIFADSDLEYFETYEIKELPVFDVGNPQPFKKKEINKEENTK